MATSRNSSREFGDKRNQQSQNYYERNRTFSSTTTDHFRNKLAQIGIEKDLRELLERKRLQKDQNKNLPNTSVNSSNENTPKPLRKVRFDGETVPVRRSKSFTSDITKSQENHPQTQRPFYNRFFKENNLEVPQNFNKNNRIRKPDFVDLHHPSNIKIEVKTDTGARKCMVDPSVSIADVKCDLKKSRNVLKHIEPKEKVLQQQVCQTERKNENVRGSGHYRGNYQRAFNKKNRENKKENYLQNKEENSSAVSTIEGNLSNLSIEDDDF